jgi:hypothetical protein
MRTLQLRQKLPDTLRPTPRAMGRIVTFVSVGLFLVQGGLVLRQLDALPRTDDAIVTANTIRVVPEITGRIATLNVKDDASVRKGDVLYTIESERYELNLAAARAQVQALEAEIDLADRRVTSQVTAIAVARAHADAARARLKETADTLARLEPLLPDRFVTPQQIDLARTGKPPPRARSMGARPHASQAASKAEPRPYLWTIPPGTSWRASTGSAVEQWPRRECWRTPDAGHSPHTLTGERAGSRAEDGGSASHSKARKETGRPTGVERPARHCPSCQGCSSGRGALGSRYSRPRNGCRVLPFCHSESEGRPIRWDRAGQTRRNLDGLVTPRSGPARLWLRGASSSSPLGRPNGSRGGPVFRRPASAEEPGPSWSRVMNSPARRTWSVAARKAGPQLWASMDSASLSVTSPLWLAVPGRSPAL